MIDVQEAHRREESFIGNLSGAQDDYEWIVEHQAWTALGYDGFADWWEVKVRPVMRALSMRPTREVVSAGVEQVRREEADLPPAWRRTQQEIGEMFGVSDETVARAIGARSPQATYVAGDDLDLALMPDGPRYCKYCYGEHELRIGDDGSLIVCTNCGAGLAPVEYVREAGGYDAWVKQITDRFVEAQRAPWRDPPGETRLLTRGEVEDTRSSAQLIVQSITNEWYTPDRYLTAARLVLGGIDLDPASCEEANRTVGATTFYTKDDDGLAQQWHGRVWLNPPYGRLAGDFVARLVDEHAAGNVTSAVILINAHCTDTRWFQPLWDHMLCFTDHRIDFSAGTDDRSGSTHGSVFAYLGPDRRLFADTFAQFGATVARYA